MQNAEKVRKEIEETRMGLRGNENSHNQEPIPYSEQVDKQYKYIGYQIRTEKERVIAKKEPATSFDVEVIDEELFAPNKKYLENAGYIVKEDEDGIWHIRLEE